MNDNDIIKALERYADNERKNASCDGCSLEKYFPYCNRECSEDALYVMWLDIINRYKAEIERLNTNMDAMVKEHKRLIADAKTEAIKEFAERLSEKAPHITEERFHILWYEIDNLVKEMTEGEDEEN